MRLPSQSPSCKLMTSRRHALLISLSRADVWLTQTILVFCVYVSLLSCIFIFFTLDRCGRSGYADRVSTFLHLTAPQ